MIDRSIDRLGAPQETDARMNRHRCNFGPRIKTHTSIGTDATSFLIHAHLSDTYVSNRLSRAQYSTFINLPFVSCAYTYTFLLTPLAYAFANLLSVWDGDGVQVREGGKTRQGRARQDKTERRNTDRQKDARGSRFIAQNLKLYWNVVISRKAP